MKNDGEFFDENEERCGGIRKQDKQRREHQHPLEKYGCAHPKDGNILIYHGRRRHIENWIERTEMKWFDKEPQTKAEISRGKYAIRDLCYPY